MHPEQLHEITVNINGDTYTRQVPARMLLSDFIRHDLELHGTNVGCEHGACGACTILVDGRTARSCLTFAVQADGCELLTIEGLADGDRLHPLQEAMWEEHGLQCGFCTPGIVLSVYEYLRDRDDPGGPDEIREALGGSICRCTGYVHIVRAAQRAAHSMSNNRGSASG